MKYEQKTVKTKNFSIFSGEAWIDDLGFSTYGKGISKDLAKASTFGEMVERFSTGFFRFYILDPNATKYSELLEDVIERKYLKGYEINEDPSLESFNTICQYFQKKPSLNQYNLFKKGGFFDTIVDSYSLINKKYTKVPIHLIDMMAGSNGLAAGNTIEEAIVQATCEIFERYATSKIISERKERPTIDSSSIQDEKVQNYLEMYESMNIDVILKDFSFENKVPVIGVIFINRNIENHENRLKKNLYFKRIHPGSHINLNEAILRCLMEYMQGSNQKELMKREIIDDLYYMWVDFLGKEYKKSSEDFKSFFTEYHYRDDLTFLEKGQKISFNKLNSVKNSDCKDDVNLILNICKKNNWDLQVIDCTHKILQFPTVRVIIPPISTDHDLFVRKILTFNKDSDRVNFYYGIKNFYEYINNNEWINNKKIISQLIIDIEDSISRDPNSFQLHLMEERHFYQYFNLFHILAFCYLSLERYEEALKYFKVLYKLKYKVPDHVKYFKVLYDLKYNPSVYSPHIKVLEKALKNNQKLPNFKFKSNPFKQETPSCFSEELISSLLLNINNSFSKS